MTLGSMIKRAMAMALLLAAASARAASGGPDAAGYSWYDASSGCPVVPDTFAAGESATFDGPWAIGPIDIGFPFPFEGRMVRQVWAHRNGLLIFESPVDDPRWWSQPIPQAGDGLKGFVAGFWDQLSVTDPSLWWSRDLAAGVFKLSFRGEWFRSGAPVELEYYLRRDGDIRVENLRVGDGGSTAAVGLESFDEASGLQVWRNGTGAGGFQLASPSPGSICYHRASTLDCAAAAPLACGVTPGFLPAGTGTVATYSCAAGWAGPEVAYRLDLTELSNVSVRLSPAAGQRQAVFLLSACTEWACLDGGDLDATASALPPGPVYVLVDSETPLDAGAFTLEVACAPFAAPLACGDAAAGTTAGGATLSDAYPCVPGALSGPEAYYSIDYIGAPAPLNLSLEAGSALTVLVFPDGLAPGPSTCLGGGQGGAVLTGLPAGRYLVGVDSPPGAGAPFTLSASCSSELSCAGAPPASCNVRVSGDTASGESLADFYACSTSRYAGPEQVYHLANPVDQVVSLLLDDAADPGLDLFLLSSCDEAQCLGGADRELTRWLPAGSYVVVVDGPSAAGAPFTLLPACGLGLEPARLTHAGSAGQCFADHETGWLTPTIPKADIVFCLDVSLSMAGELASLQASIAQLMDWTALHVQDPAFGLSSIVDYVSDQDGFDPCDYFGSMYGLPGDYPYRLHHAVSTNRASVIGALDSLVIQDGLDEAEAYTRGLHEAVADAALGWRPGARRVLVMFGDEIPHDCNPLECLGDVSMSPRGIDFGRDGLAETADDLVLLDVVQELADARIALVYMESGGLAEMAMDTTEYPYRQVWGCLAARTGGAVGVLNDDGSTVDGSPLSDVVGPLVVESAGRCASLVLAAEPGFEPWLADPGVAYSDVRLPAVREWDIRTCIPPGTAPGPHEFEVRMLCDGAPMAATLVHVDVADSCAPLLGAAAARDPSPCSAGLEVTWPAADFTSAGGTGVYNVYRSELGCADALLQPPLATGLTGIRWFDATSPGGGRAFHYVVEAEGSAAGGSCTPLGAHHGGPAARACIDPPVRDDGFEPFPDGVYATLRARHAGDLVTFHWEAARALAGAEHFHLLKARLDPSGSFTHVNGESSVARQWTETDLGARVQFFDLRVANSCEDLSFDEYPPGYDHP